MTTENPTAPQPAPKPGSARPTWELVIEDMKARDRFGAEKYGVRHQHDNGRDHIVDAYQELLDGALYLRAEIEKQLAAARAMAGICENCGHECNPGETCWKCCMPKAALAPPEAPGAVLAGFRSVPVPGFPYQRNRVCATCHRTLAPDEESCRCSAPPPVPPASVGAGTDDLAQAMELIDGAAKLACDGMNKHAARTAGSREWSAVVAKACDAGSAGRRAQADAATIRAQLTEVRESSFKAHQMIVDLRAKLDRERETRLAVEAERVQEHAARVRVEARVAELEAQLTAPRPALHLPAQSAEQNAALATAEADIERAETALRHAALAVHAAQRLVPVQHADNIHATERKS